MKMSLQAHKLYTDDHRAYARLDGLMHQNKSVKHSAKSLEGKFVMRVDRSGRSTIKEIK